MSAYRRFVAYVYEYQGEQKKENRGFIKVEARSGSCSIEVHLQSAGLAPEQTCVIYGFVRENQNLAGIELGRCKTQPQKIQCRLVTNAEDLNGSGVSLEALGGIVLLLDGGGFYGTQWDDKGISPLAFHERKKGVEEKDIAKEEPEDAEDGNIKTRDEERKEEEAGEVQESEENNREETDEKENEIQAEDGEKEEPTGQEAEPEVTEEKIEKTEEEMQASVEDEQQKESQPKPPEENVMEQNEKEEFLEGGMQIEAQEAAEAQAEVFWPFPDGEIAECRKITPREFQHFQKRDWALGSNRFLLYGYQQFGYLLLGRLRSSGQYILGVPGIYDQQERFMANMFGFPHFKASRLPEFSGSKGGYWYRLINPPNLHAGNRPQ